MLTVAQAGSGPTRAAQRTAPRQHGLAGSGTSPPVVYHGRHDVNRSRPSQCPILRRCSCGGQSDAGGQCAECQEKALDAGGSTAPPIVHDVLRSPGERLPDGLRAEFEARMGADLSAVRLHRGPMAEASARSVGGKAFTVGHHVVFGLEAPGGEEGRRLLSHELVHVVQQQAAGPIPSRLEIGRIDDPSEQEAARFASVGVATPTLGEDPAVPTASRMLALQRFASDRMPTSVVVQRQGDGTVSSPTLGDGVSQLSTGRCHTCDIPGGVGICCLKPGAPMIPECFEQATRIIDQCGRGQECLDRASCVMCQCSGPTYCDCGGIG
jgi:hypothetical protein